MFRETFVSEENSRPNVPSPLVCFRENRTDFLTMSVTAWVFRLIVGLQYIDLSAVSPYTSSMQFSVSQLHAHGNGNQSRIKQKWHLFASPVKQCSSDYLKLADLNITINDMLVIGSMLAIY